MEICDRRTTQRDEITDIPQSDIILSAPQRDILEEAITFQHTVDELRSQKPLEI